MSSSVKFLTLHEILSSTKERLLCLFKGIHSLNLVHGTVAGISTRTSLDVESCIVKCLSCFVLWGLCPRMTSHVVGAYVLCWSRCGSVTTAARWWTTRTGSRVTRRWSCCRRHSTWMTQVACRNLDLQQSNMWCNDRVVWTPAHAFISLLVMCSQYTLYIYE